MRTIVKIIALLFCLVLCSPEVWACTSLLVGKKVSGDGGEMPNERPIGTRQSAYVFMAQVRSNLDGIGSYYSLMIDDLRTVQNGLEDQFTSDQDSIESAALKFYADYSDKVKAMLTGYAVKPAEETFHDWKTLGEDLIVKYNGCGARDSKTGRIKRISASEDYSREVL